MGKIVISTCDSCRKIIAISDNAVPDETKLKKSLYEVEIARYYRDGEEPPICKTITACCQTCVSEFVDEQLRRWREFGELSDEKEFSVRVEIYRRIVFSSPTLSSIK